MCSIAYASLASAGRLETLFGIDSTMALAYVKHRLGDFECAQALRRQALEYGAKTGATPIKWLAPRDFYDNEVRTPKIAEQPSKSGSAASAPEFKSRAW
mmetsp:Transcript_127988/g.410075  ORF Transcript_127988/g.410075 Transcript_127988/m.410075 type:complete len:99 (+) Transcript_127988:185-481(+)